MPPSDEGDGCECFLWKIKRATSRGSGRQLANEDELMSGTTTGGGFSESEIGGREKENISYII